MQVRLYSLAGRLQQHESAFTDQPLVVQRLPSKLSSLAWDHNQNVGLLCVALPVLSGDLHDCIIALIRNRCLVCVRWNYPCCVQLLLYDQTPCSCDICSILLLIFLELAEDYAFSQRWFWLCSTGFCSCQA